VVPDTDCFLFDISGHSYRISKGAGWSIASILEEFEMYCESEGDVPDMLFIENFCHTPAQCVPAAVPVPVPLVTVSRAGSASAAVDSESAGEREPT